MVRTKQTIRSAAAVAATKPAATKPKKTPVRKTPAKKTPAKKTPAKNVASKKATSEPLRLETLRRLAKKAVGPDGVAVERFGKPTAKILRKEAMASLGVIVLAADSFRVNAKRGTVTQNDVIAALALFGIQFGNGFKKGQMQMFPVFRYKNPGTRKNKQGEMVQVKPRSSTKMKELQNARESFVLTRASIETVTYGILQTANPGSKIRVALKAKDALHVFVEARLLDLISTAAVIMKTNNDKKVFKEKYIEAAISLKPLTMAVANPVANVELGTYIEKVHDSIKDGTGMEAQAKDQIQRLVNIVFSRILAAAASLIKEGAGKTARAQDISAAVKIVFGQSRGAKSLSSLALGRIEAAVVKFSENKKGQAASRAGLNFPPTRLLGSIKVVRGSSSMISSRVSAKTGAALAAVLELVAAEILEASGNLTLENKRQRINSTYVRMAIQNDPELMYLFGNTIIGADMNTAAGVASYLEKKEESP